MSPPSSSVPSSGFAFGGLVVGGPPEVCVAPSRARSRKSLIGLEVWVRRESEGRARLGNKCASAQVGTCLIIEIEIDRVPSQAPLGRRFLSDFDFDRDRDFDGCSLPIRIYRPHDRHLLPGPAAALLLDLVLRGRGERDEPA